MIKFLVVLVGVVGLISGNNPAMACDEASSRLVAKAYVLTIPLLNRANELIPIMQSNQAHFSQGGSAIRCMQNLGAALVQGGLAQNNQFGGNTATERFGGQMPPGLAHLPGQVDNSMQSYGSDMFTMGQELRWLANVLPAAAQGNYVPYNTTGTQTRRTMNQVLPIYQMLCQMDPSICQMMLGMLGEMTPQVEQQIYLFARQLGN